MNWKNMVKSRQVYLVLCLKIKITVLSIIPGKVDCGYEEFPGPLPRC